jgi:hypothetical protein
MSFRVAPYYLTVIPAFAGMTSESRDAEEGVR